MTVWTTTRLLRNPLRCLRSGGFVLSVAIPMVCAGIHAQIPQAQIPQAQLPQSRPIDQPWPLALSDADLPDGFVGFPLSISVAAFGGTGAYSILVAGDLPPGVVLLRSGNVIGVKGVPTAGGDYLIRVAATDVNSGRSVDRTYSLHIGGQLVQPQAMTANISDSEGFHLADADSVFFPAKISDAEGFHLTDANSVFMPLSVKESEGFKLTDTVSIFGPDKPADAENLHFGDFVVIRTSAMIADPEALHFSDVATIATKIGVSPSTVPAGTYQTAYSQVFSAAGNTGAATLTSSGTLPNGLSFTGSGSSITLSGKPTQVGTFPFTITAKDTANTSIVSYSLVINKASQNITFPQPTTPVTYYTGENVTLTATSSAGVSYPVSYAVSGPATLSGSNLTYTGAGTVTVTATQAGDSNYNAATPVQVSIAVQLPADTIFIANSSGTVASLLQNGTQQSGATPGGGIGVAVDSLGYVWSINTAGSGLTKFNDTGASAASYSPSGMSGATALVFDGNSDLWVANGNGALLEISPAGALVSTVTPTTTKAVGAVIDEAGSLWLLNGNAVVKVVGVAAPVLPLTNAVDAGTPATKP